MGSAISFYGTKWRTLLIVVRTNYSTTAEGNSDQQKDSHNNTHTPDQGFSTRDSWPSLETSAGRGAGWGMTQHLRIDPRDDAQHPTQAKESAHNKELFSQNVSA